jgi:hypothetical protein
MNYSNGNNGNLNIPNNFGINNNMSYPPPFQGPNNNGNFYPGGQGQQGSGQYTTNFNPFDILGRRI